VPALAARPEYAIRLANTNGWDATTGWNNLNAGLIVTATLNAGACTIGDIPVVLKN
jgi:hypothetical protein